MTFLMPALFVGHGSPLNALGNNLYEKELHSIRKYIPTPKSILIISAHWETIGTQIGSAKWPETIYDFYGFPEKLYTLKYPVSGDPDLALKIKNLFPPNEISLNANRGLDHGAWAVLLQLYPEANIPCLQLSINKNITLEEHFYFAKKLQALRGEGILILASGNLTHNLHEIVWEEKAPAFDWAKEFEENITQAIIENDISTLLGINKIEKALWKKAHPTLDHYIPLLYVLAQQTTDSKIRFFNDEIQNGSMSMRSVLLF